MSCIKTGVQVYFLNYGQTISADLYKVGAAYVISTHPEQLHLNMNGALPLDFSGIVVEAGFGANEYWSPHKGTFVVERDAITEVNWTLPA